jgi:hypothetical protein
MANFFKFILIGLRIFICYKFITLLYQSSANYDDLTLKHLDWWVAYLVFDIWLQFVIPSSYNNDEKE